MKVAEAVEHMTVAYLRRIIDSFTKDFPKPDEERAREIIVQNTGELTDRERIKRKLQDSDLPYSTRVLQHNVLEALLDQPERMASEEAIVEDVISLEEEILREAEDPESLSYEDESSLEILREVLEVAVADDEVTQDELSLVHRLRRKLASRSAASRSSWPSWTISPGPATRSTPPRSFPAPSTISRSSASSSTATGSTTGSTSSPRRSFPG